MDNITYKYGNDDITVWKDSHGIIHVYEDNNDMEIEFYHTEVYKALEVLENIHNYLLNNPAYIYIDISSYEDEGSLDWYWTDDLMYNEDINPYFSPEGSFTGNCLYKEKLIYIIQAIKEYFNPKDISNIDNLTLKSILRLKRNLQNEN
jgi:hypothetical protein